MSARRTERLLNLLIMLLVQRRYLTKARIRDVLYADVASDEAFERMFERDKDELRSLGVPIDTGSDDPLFDDELGYRINPDEFALPPIELDANEASVLALAGHVWDQARLSQATAHALRKLRADGVALDSSALDVVQPRLNADEPSFATFADAALTRTEIRFAYAAAHGEVTQRRVHPWGVVRYRGRWYAIGFDIGRGAERVFRLDRVQGEPREHGPSAAYDLPAELDLRAMVARWGVHGDSGESSVLLRAGAGVRLRREANEITLGVLGPDDDTSWDRVIVGRTTSIVDDVLALGPDAVLESPAHARDQLKARLQEFVGLGGRQEGGQ